MASPFTELPVTAWCWWGFLLIARRSPASGFNCWSLSASSGLSPPKSEARPGVEEAGGRGDAEGAVFDPRPALRAPIQIVRRGEDWSDRFLWGDPVGESGGGRAGGFGYGWLFYVSRDMIPDADRYGRLAGHPPTLARVAK